MQSLHDLLLIFSLFFPSYNFSTLNKGLSYSTGSPSLTRISKILHSNSASSFIHIFFIRLSRKYQEEVSPLFFLNFLFFPFFLTKMGREESLGRMGGQIKKWFPNQFGGDWFIILINPINFFPFPFNSN